MSEKTGRSMTAHCDGDGTFNIFTVVGSFRVGCSRRDGANLRYASSDAGTFDQNERNGRDFSPEDNSIYCFPGSHVFYKIGGLTQGVRISIVLFLTWKDITDAQIVMYWTMKEFVCDCCLHTFKTTKSRDAHLKKNKKGECRNTRFTLVK
jgi:hypothetical protein